jgi:CubicO group peptidase (beta-lactamase class C family)
MRFILLIQLVFIFHAYSAAQTIHLAIDSLINEQNFKENEPGVAVLVLENGQIIYENQIGYANINQRIPLSENTLFNFASITKQFTAFCILKLELEGKLSRKDSIQTYLPELPYFGETITIENLLAHTSGMPDYIEILLLKNQYAHRKLTTDYLLEYLHKTPFLSFKPGERFAYSNMGYMLLKIIVERVSEQSIEKYIQYNIFNPLEMNHSSFKFEEYDALENKSISYKKNNEKYIHLKNPNPSALGATGMFGTLRDFSKWDNLFYTTSTTQNNKQIEYLINEMRKAYHLNNGSELGYANGIIIKPYHSYTFEEHSGGWNFFLLQFRRILELNTSILVASNNYEIDPFKLNDEICELIISKQLKNNYTINETSVKNDYFKNLSGTYIDANNIVRRIRLINDTLIISSLDTTHIIEKLIFINKKDTNNYTFLDENNDFVHFTIAENNETSFLWKGGTYFRFQHEYKKINNTTHYNVTEWKGKYHTDMFDFSLFIKQNRKNEMILKPFFLISYKLEHIGNNIYKIKNQNIFIKVYNDSISIGNNWVFDIPLKKVKG